MAAVRLSKSLIHSIELNAGKKMRPSIDRAREQKLDPSWGQRIYDILFDDVKPFIAQVPAGWLKTVKSISIIAVGNHTCNMEFSLTEQPWPYRYVNNELAEQAYNTSSCLRLKDHLVWGEFYAEVSAYYKRIIEATERYEEFVYTVKKICYAYSTLAQALKAWPPLLELVPEDVKDKLGKSTPRRKPKVVPDVDFDRLTALSTAAKFEL